MHVTPNDTPRPNLAEGSEDFRNADRAPERTIAQVRIIAAAVGILCYFGFLRERSAGFDFIAALLSLSLIYVVWTTWAAYGERQRAWVSRYLVNFGDSVFITVWIAATGGINSPFYVTYYASAVTTALLYGARMTTAIGLFNAASYLLILALAGEISGHGGPIFIRISYIFIIAFAAGAMANQRVKEAVSKSRMRERLRLLGRTQGELEGAVRERSAALAKANENLQAEIIVRRRAESAQRFLAESSRILASSLDANAIINGLVRLAVPFMADLCAIDLNEEVPGFTITGVAHINPRKEALALKLREYQRYLNSELPKEAILGKRSILLSDLTVTPSNGDDFYELTAKLETRSLMLVPVIVRGNAIGVMTFAISESARRYEAADVELAEEVARRAGMALANARLYHDAQVASRAKDEFLATVSHELRTPLNVMLGWARLLRLGGLEPTVTHEALRMIERNAEIQTQIVNDLLDVARIISGKMALKVGLVDLRKVMEMAMGSVRLAADAKKIALVIDDDKIDNPATVAGDQDRLQQAIWNLLANAIKFTPDGGTVRISLKTVSGGEQLPRVVLSVSDSGCGIEPQFLAHVFERFRQEDGSTTRNFGGLGLGLAIARHIVDLHGGAIEVASDGRGKGATFTIRLPLLGTPALLSSPDLRPTNMTSLKSSGPQLSVSHPAHGKLATKRILLVDNDEDVLSLLRAVLVLEGAHVVTASSAAEAYRILEEHEFNLLLIDIAMPEEDGYGLIRRIRAHSGFGKTPAVALTAYATPADREKALNIGFDLHLAKPIEPVELIGALVTLARRQGGTC